MARSDSKQSVQEQYSRLEPVFNKHVDVIKQLIVDSKETPEGSTVYQHKTFNAVPHLMTKRLNLFWAGANASEKIAEIGFNAGHSCLAMLLGRNEKNTKMAIFDICEHSYVLPSFRYVQSQYGSVNWEMHSGDSTFTLPEYIKNNPDELQTYDLIHVDGGHSLHCITNDMMHALQLLRVGGLMIVDDTNIAHINSVVENYVTQGVLRDVKLVFKTKILKHRLLEKCM